MILTSKALFDLLTGLTSLKWSPFRESWTEVSKIGLAQKINILVTRFDLNFIPLRAIYKDKKAQTHMHIVPKIYLFLNIDPPNKEHFNDHVLWYIYHTSLTGNYYTDLHHSQRVMKFDVNLQ